MKERIAIVGAGIVGQTCALSLNADKYEITVFDTQADIKNPEFLNPSIGHRSALLQNSFIKGYPGGSLVWGRNVNLALDPKWWPPEFISLIPKLQHKLQKFGFPKISGQYFDASSTEDFVLEVQVCKPLEQLAKKFSRLVDYGKITWVQSHVVESKQSSMGYELIIKDPTGEMVSLLFDKVIFCCGPVVNFIFASKLCKDALEPRSIFNHPSLQIATIHFDRPTLLPAESFSISRGLNVFRKKYCRVLRSDDRMLLTCRNFAFQPVSSNMFISSIIQKNGCSNSEKLRLIALFIKSMIMKREFAHGITVQVTLDFIEDSIYLIFDLGNHDKRPQFAFHDKNFQFSESSIKELSAYLSELAPARSEIEWKIDLSQPLDLRDFEASSHLMGSIPIELSGRSQPGVNSRLELHGSPNAFFVGSCVFPSSSPGHPTYLAALTAIYLSNRLNMESQNVRKAL